MMVSATGISNQGLDIFRHPTFNPRAIVLFKKNIIRHIKLYHAYISFTKDYLCSLNIRKIYCLHLANDFNPLHGITEPIASSFAQSKILK